MSFRCVGLGEVLWDILPTGRQLGGAPANFAYHAAALGAEAHVVSRVGDDALGRELLARLRGLGLPTDAIGVDPVAPTSTVTVAVSADGQARYTIHEDVAWDRLAAEPPAREALAAADAVCFGTLAQRSLISRDTIRNLLALTRPKSLRILDVNLRQNYFSAALIREALAFANALKINDTELPQLVAMFGLPADDRAAITALVAEFGLRAVAFTRGSRGSLIYADGAWCDQPGQPVKVVDTVGAGDSFTAAFALGLLHRWPVATISERATAVSAFVCSQPGATPTPPTDLVDLFKSTA